MRVHDAIELLRESGRNAVEDMNRFSKEVLLTRGGRIGSGMGLLLEALWGYYTNQGLRRIEEERRIELAWLYGHEYNDFACVLVDKAWDPDARKGELLRVEAKSMVEGADESKAHFDELASNIGKHDLLAVLMWAWTPTDEDRVYPEVKAHFINRAVPIAHMRDQLHEARGGSFVDPNHCPDGCTPADCPHAFEPLNANGKRERKTGPETTRVSDQTSHAQNFGGMIRMVKCDSGAAARRLAKLYVEDAVVREYVDMVYDFFPNEETNVAKAEVWKRVAEDLGMDVARDRKDEVVARVRNQPKPHREALFRALLDS